MLLRVLAAAAVLTTSVVVTAGDDLPSGVFVASAGERVFIAEAASGKVLGLQAGTVGWLYPAPGGIVYAPDLVAGTTTVVDLHRWRVADRLEGVTMPHFGGLDDRYVVVAGDVYVTSYPERAPIARIEAGITDPWQVSVTDDNGLAFVLCRALEGPAEPELVAVDLLTHKVAYRRGFEDDVVRMALSAPLGVIALADAAGSRVIVAEPSGLVPVLVLNVDGSPVDVCFVGERGVLAAVSDLGDGTGALMLVTLKQGRDGLTAKKSRAVALSGRPERLAADPWGERVAIGFESGRVEVRHVKRGKLVAEVLIPQSMRDLIWCDPSTPGPLIPEWSDQQEEPPKLQLDFRSFEKDGTRDDRP